MPRAAGVYYDTGAPGGGIDRDLFVRTDDTVPPNATGTNIGLWQKQGNAYVRAAARLKHGDNHAAGGIDPILPSDIKAVPASVYRGPLLYAVGAATTAATSGGKYVCRGTTDAGSINAATTGQAYLLWTGADYAITGLTTKLRVSALIRTGVAPAVTITVSLYSITVGSVDTLNAAVTGSTLTFTTPGANADTVLVSSDFTAPADGNYALGYTVSGTPAAAFGVHAFVQVRNV